MPRKIFVNLPVKNLKKSMAFFERLGFSFNPQFTDDTAACMIISNDIFTMLLTHEKFASFTPNTLCDSKKSTEVLICLSCESRNEVDTLVQKAIASGGNSYNQSQDHGFMYQHGFQDPDGHIWELVYMQQNEGGGQ